MTCMHCPTRTNVPAGPINTAWTSSWSSRRWSSRNQERSKISNRSISHGCACHGKGATSANYRFEHAHGVTALPTAPSDSRFIAKRHEMAGCRGSPDKVPRPEQCEQRTSCHIPNLQVLFQDFIWFQRQKRNTAQPKWSTLGRAQDKPSAANRKDVLDER